MKMEIQKQLEVFWRGTAEIISEEELVQKLKKGRPLRVKLGVDPSAPDLHLGHTVPLRKLKQLQDIGHRIIFLIGDFTGRIGDPTGRSETRKQLSAEEINENAETYKEQVFKILDPAKTIVEYNSSWLASLTFSDVIKLAGKYTVARMLERDDFARRYRERRPIGIHEFMYPLMQGYDSIVLQADVEIGGTDQKFNLLMGRHLQREMGQEPQICLTLPILEGLDGVNKMSKSLGNHIGIYDPPAEMYGKTMSLPDHLMVRYFELVTNVSLEEIREIKEGLNQGTLHPRDVKMRLAREIVALYHDHAAAREAEDSFKAVFQRGDLPTEIPEVSLAREELQDGRIWVARLLVLLGLAKSNSEARRLIKQGGVTIAGERIDDPERDIVPAAGMIVQVGKRRFVKIMM
ncbi:MAG TPA: tyrosine--tRNA ligase [Firmicutes bacterium]|nr:tyrosine--tRNA ligase [Bacillota bacterium]